MNISDDSPFCIVNSHFFYFILEDVLQEIRAIHDMEPKPSFLDSPAAGEVVGESVDMTEFEAEKERIISNEELQYLVEKLHRFAKL